MYTQRIKQILDWSVTIGSLLVISYVCTQLYEARNLKHLSRVAAQRKVDLSALPGIAKSGGIPSILVALKLDCVYCLRSAPFYRRLLTLRDTTNFRLVIATPDDKEKLRNRLTLSADEGVEFANIELHRLGVNGTPTLAVVDDGKVLRQWTGLLSPEKESEVFSVVQALSANRQSPGN